jgi:hypothetical protein
MTLSTAEATKWNCDGAAIDELAGVVRRTMQTARHVVAAWIPPSERRPVMTPTPTSSSFPTTSLFHPSYPESKTNRGHDNRRGVALSMDSVVAGHRLRQTLLRRDLSATSSSTLPKRPGPDGEDNDVDAKISRAKFHNSLP